MEVKMRKKNIRVQKVEKRFNNPTNEKIEFETKNTITGIKLEQNDLKITISNFGVEESFVVDYETGKNLKIMDTIKVNRRLE